MFKALRRHLTLLCVIFTGITLLGVTLVSLAFMIQKIKAQKTASFQVAQKTVFIYLSGQPLVSHTWLASAEQNNNITIGLFQGENPLFFTSQSPVRLHLSSAAFQKAIQEYNYDPYLIPKMSSLEPLSFDLSIDGESYRCAALSIATSSLPITVFVLQNRILENGEIRQVILSLIGFFLLFLFLLFVLSYYYTGHAIRPIEENQKRQEDFVSAASHELRSPLSVIQATAGVMEDAPPAQLQYFLKKIEDECDRMAKLTDDLLRLASLEKGKTRSDPKKEEPETLLMLLAEDIEPLFNEKGIHFRVVLPPEPLPHFFCDSALVVQALRIYVDNALEYTPTGGIVTLSVWFKKGKVVFSVTDTGPGVSDAEKKKIFERFFQSDPSRTHKKHYGLGLSIAAEIARVHGGTALVTDAPGGGADFQLVLPIHF